MVSGIERHYTHNRHASEINFAKTTARKVLVPRQIRVEPPFLKKLDRNNRGQFVQLSAPCDTQHG
jgi:hypothetical protein